MTFASRPLWALLVAALLLPLAACDETGGLSANVDVAVEDAVIARQSGDYEAAVALLEDALDREPENASVRVELATTILERDDIDLLDVDQIAQYVTDGIGGTAAQPATSEASASEARSACSVGDDATAFDPTDLAGFADLTQGAASIRRALELLRPIMPEAISGFSICQNVVDGQLSYDRDGAIAELRARGLSETRVAQVLAVNALANLIDAYLFVSTELPAQTTWYRLADGSITICAQDADALRTEAEAAIADLGEAVLSLDARASLLGEDSAASDLVDLALDAFEEIRDAVGDYCASA
ncbi:MAG: tetratricopeptide repeat protein [Bacteroidota bacterium]